MKISFDRFGQRMQRRQRRHHSVTSQVARVQQLEDRCMLSGATFSLNSAGNALRVEGTAADEMITVSQNGLGNFEIDCDGVITDTGIANDGTILSALRSMAEPATTS